MKFTISTIYASPDTEFQVSGKTTALIARTINEAVMPLNGLDAQKSAWKINLMISVDVHKTERKLCAPEIYKTQRVENHVVWIPFANVKTTQGQQTESYLNEVLVAAALVLARYGLLQETVLNLKQRLIEETSGNPLYAYKPKFKPDIQGVLARANKKSLPPKL